MPVHPLMHGGFMAQAKPRTARVSKVTPQEQGFVTQLEKLTELKNPTDAQKEQRKALRKQIAPLRFVRLAQQRVPRAIKAIHAVGKLTGAGYAHTEENAAKILKGIDAAIESVRAKLTGKETEAETFTL